MTTATIRTHIERAGGLLNQGDIATVLGVSRTRVSQLVGLPAFPAPLLDGELAPGGRAVWLATDVDAWRERRGTVGT